MHADQEVLAAFALGEPVDPADIAHLTGCPECNPLVAEFRTVMALVRDSAREELVSPPDSVWEAIAAEVAADSAAPAPSSAGAPGSGSGSGDELAARRRRPMFGGLALAAAVGLIAGAAGTQLVPDLFSPPPTVVAVAALETLDTGAALGEAELLSRTTDSLDLRVRVDPLDPSGGFLEVWLINSDLKRMVSIGVLPASVTSQDFAVTADLIDQGYVIVDISREQFDDRPEHSGDSLVRGNLT